MISVILTSNEDGVTFSRFYLTVENENKSLSAGSFQLYQTDISQYSQECPNTIIQISQIEKNEITVYWTSPDKGNGCVIFR
jgi:site-specific recombinase XerD